MSISSTYPLFGVAVVGGVSFALWGGLSPLLLVVLTCPLMMFLMMRGMTGGLQAPAGDGRVGHQEPPAGRLSGLDGPHERIERP